LVAASSPASYREENSDAIAPQPVPSALAPASIASSMKDEMFSGGLQHT
jgi:hypothetical protein